MLALLRPAAQPAARTVPSTRTALPSALCTPSTHSARVSLGAPLTYAPTTGTPASLPYQRCPGRL